MEVDRTHTQETSRNHHLSSHHMEPPREHLAKRHRKGNKIWDTPGERWRGWPSTENSDVPWSMAYAPSEQTGIMK